MSKFETRRLYAISIYDTVAYGQSIKRNRIDILWSYFNIYHRIVFFDRHRREITYSFKSTVSNWLYYLPLPVITSNVHSHVYWSSWYLPELFCRTEIWRYVFFLIISSWWVPYIWQEILCGSWSMTFQRTLQIEEHSHINILVNLDVIEE